MDMLLLYLLTIVAGTTMSIQAGINAQLQSHWAQSPILAACVSFIVGALALTTYVLVTRIPVPPLPVKFTPWHWTGGLLGAFLVSVTVYVAPRLGASTMIALILAGQIGASLIIDHFGLIGYTQKTLNWQRAAGALLLAAGVYVIRRY